MQSNIVESLACYFNDKTKEIVTIQPVAHCAVSPACFWWESSSVEIVAA